jgi:hypothetical protein
MVGAGDLGIIDSGPIKSSAMLRGIQLIVISSVIAVLLSATADADAVQPAAGSGSQHTQADTTQESPGSEGWDVATIGVGAAVVSALVGLVVYLGNSRRKPRLIESSGSEPNGPEWIEVVAVARRRPIEAQEIGLVFSWGRPWSRNRHWHPGSPRPALPRHLQDGGMVETGFEVSALIDDLCEEIGDSVRQRAVSRPYLKGSGKVYRGRGSTGSLRARSRAVWRSLRVAGD